VPEANVQPARAASPYSSQWPSNDVIVAAQDGDEIALEALILGSHPHVTRFAMTLCSTREDAEDAVQEALTVLYRRVGTLRVSAALGSWMFQVVKNECIRRSRATFRSRSLQGRVAAFLVDERDATSEDALSRIEAQRVAAALAQLPAPYRRVLVLRDLQSLSGSEVAQRLGLSKSAMKSTLHRARVSLREVLERTNPCD
jgi:RNA polymerase sigma factor (sigma-70 family)